MTLCLSFLSFGQVLTDCSSLYSQVSPVTFLRELDQFVQGYHTFTQPKIEQSKWDHLQTNFTHSKTVLSDQGAAFKDVAELEGWNHIYDQKHFLNEIQKHWGGLANAAEFRSEVFLILEMESTDEDEFQQRLIMPSRSRNMVLQRQPLSLKPFHETDSLYASIALVNILQLVIYLMYVLKVVRLQSRTKAQ